MELPDIGDAGLEGDVRVICASDKVHSSAAGVVSMRSPAFPALNDGSKKATPAFPRSEIYSKKGKIKMLIVTCDLHIQHTYGPFEQTAHSPDPISYSMPSLRYPTQITTRIRN